MPYAPGIQYRGSDYLFSGLSQAGQNTREWLTNFANDKKESAGLDTALQGMTAAHSDDPSFLRQYGEQLGKSAGMSLSQKKALAGTLAGYTAQKMQETQMRNATADEQRKQGLYALAKQASQRQESTAQDEENFGQVLGAHLKSNYPAMQQYWEESGNAGQPAPSASPDYAEALGAALQAGPKALKPAELSALFRAHQAGQEAAKQIWGGPSVVTKTDEAGKPVRFAVTGPNQSSVIPEDVTPSIEPLMNPDGTPSGHAAVRGEKGQLHIIKLPTEPTEKTEVTTGPDGTVLQTKSVKQTKLSAAPVTLSAKDAAAKVNKEHPEWSKEQKVKEARRLAGFE